MKTFEKLISSLYRIILQRDISPPELESRLRTIDESADASLCAISLAEELLNSDEFKDKYGLNPSSFHVKDPDVYYAYKFFLGRLPEGEHIYHSKKKSKDIGELLHTLTTSEEFKTNPILKKSISIRRKPVGLDDVDSDNSSSKKIIVLSGCQGKTIADLFQVKTGAPSVPHQFMGGVALTDFVSSHPDDRFQTLGAFDLIYTQKADVYNALQLDDRLKERARLMPIIEYVAFQPDQTYIIKNTTEERIIGPMGEYQSLIVAAAFYSGITEEKCARLFNTSTYTALGFDRIGSASRVDITAQTEKTGYPMLELAAKWDAEGKWMRTINHPKKFVLSDLVDFALRQENIDILDNVDEYVTDELATNVDWPVYPNTDSSSKTAPDLRFKMPSALAPLTNAARFLSLHEFISATYKSLAPHPLESVHFKQLDRSIAIDDAIKTLVTMDL